jgi:hypothetical protein
MAWSWRRALNGVAIIVCWIGIGAGDRCHGRGLLFLFYVLRHPYSVLGAYK